LAKRVPGNDRLRRAREERNWTQAEVAQAVGTSSFTVSRWELGVQVPQAHFREKLCALFGLGPQELGLIAEPPPAAPVDSREPGESRARRDLRAQVWGYWIGTELETAVGSLPRIDLALTECPDAVDDPRRPGPRSHEPRRPREPETTIDAAYWQAGEQLLILGDPGAGKTTLLLELTRALLEAPPGAGPMPAVFHLASWAEERRPLASWLVDELHRRYGVAPRLGRAWIADEQVLPLLDGLDEVAQEHRAGCVAAIDAFHAEHGQLPLVVCCRTAEYESLGVRLRLRGAIVIQPLTRAQVDRCLAASGDVAAEFRALLQADARLGDLLKTPLFLRMIVRTYGGERAAGPPLRGTLPERRRRVLADYVEEMLARPRAVASAPAYPPDQTVRWLAWLARAMRDRSEGVFHLDWMQPTWLPAGAQRRAVMLAPAALVVIVGGLVGMLTMMLATVLPGGERYVVDLSGPGAGLSGRLAASALTGAAVGVLAGLLAAAFTYESRIAPTNRLAWSWTTFRRNFPAVLAAVLAALPLSLLLDRVMSGVAAHLAYGLLLVLLFTAFTRPALRRRLPGRPGPAVVLAALAAAVAVATAAAVASGSPLPTLAFRVAARLVVGLSLGLMFGPRTPLSETVPAPGQGIAMSRRHGLAAGVVSGGLAALLFGVVAGAGVGVTSGAAAGVVTGLLDGLSIGAIVGTGVGLRRGGGASLRHALLRRLLVRAGAAPRDYVGFLEHAAGLILLRRRGGGYEFVHRLLLDHFADPVAIRCDAWQHGARSRE